MPTVIPQGLIYTSICIFFLYKTISLSETINIHCFFNIFFNSEMAVTSSFGPSDSTGKTTGN